MKRLLTMFIVALAVVAQANAAPADGYVYTSGGRYKVLSDNLIANGDFSAGLDGWVTESGEPVARTCLRWWQVAPTAKTASW